MAIEGRHDGGALGRSSAVMENDPHDEGALQPLIRKAIGAVDMVGLKVQLISLEGIDSPPKALAKRARAASALARYEGCDAFVLHQDADGPGNGTDDDGSRRWHDTVEAIEAGASEADEHDEGLSAAACVPCVPLRTIESWLLADQGAVARCARPSRVAEPIVAPEELWGRPLERDRDHPKQVLRRVVGPPTSRRDYRALAEAADLDVIEAGCPVSFSAFRRRLVEAA